MSCAEGDTGFIYAGALPFEPHTDRSAAWRDAAHQDQDRDERGQPPSSRSTSASCPMPGVALARLEIIINKPHRRAPPPFWITPNRCRPEKIDAKTAGPWPYADRWRFYVDKVAGRATITAAFWPNPVIVRLSDFKSNEYQPT